MHFPAGSHANGIGSADDITLAIPRELARDARSLLREGKDPIEAKAANKQADAGRRTTFREAAESYIAAHEAGWKNEVHPKQWTSTLETYAHPVLGSMPVSDIAVGHVMSVLQPIWHEVTETASRVRSRIENILDYAAVQGWRPGENPARWKGYLAKLLPAKSTIAPVKHHASMAWEECPAFMRELTDRTGAGALALRFTMLTRIEDGRGDGGYMA